MEEHPQRANLAGLLDISASKEKGLTGQTPKPHQVTSPQRIRLAFRLLLNQGELGLCIEPQGELVYVALRFPDLNSSATCTALIPKEKVHAYTSSSAKTGSMQKEFPSKKAVTYIFDFYFLSIQTLPGSNSFPRSSCR